MNHKLLNSELTDAAQNLANKIQLFSELHRPSWEGQIRIFGIPRGGVSASYLLAAYLNGVVLESDPHYADIIVDDLVDSGETMRRYMGKYPNAVFAALFMKPQKDSDAPTPAKFLHGATVEGWVTFPWEVMETGHDGSTEDSVIRMLQAIGEDPSREGLQETPKRVVKAWREWFKGYGMNPADFLKVFEDGAEKVDEMVLLTDIPVYSHCEHHVTPFIGIAHVAYIPNGKIVGLSKIARVVETYARRLQVQERLTNQIADCLVEHLQPLGVAVVITAKHFCMATRGVNMPNVDTTTSAVRGVFREKPEVRAEFMSLLPKR